MILSNLFWFVQINHTYNYFIALNGFHFLIKHTKPNQVNFQEHFIELTNKKKLTSYNLKVVLWKLPIQQENILYW